MPLSSHSIAFLQAPGAGGARLGELERALGVSLTLSRRDEAPAAGAGAGAAATATAPHCTARRMGTARHTALTPVEQPAHGVARHREHDLSVRVLVHGYR